MIRESLAVTVLALAVPLTAVAQVSVRQGNLAVEDPKQFASPMIVDVPLRHLAELAVGQARSFTDLRGYYCEDATIESLMLARKSSKRSSGKGVEYARFEISGVVAVRASYDRFVTLNFSLVSGDTVEATANVSRMSVEEKKSRSFKATFDVSPEAMEKLTSAEAAPVLRVVVIVAADN